MIIAHISDTHIRNLKFHYEYRKVFDQLYTKLIEENVDYIVHCGDIAHTKTQIPPEFVQLCSEFLSNLADIAPTYVILGNHDGNLKNSSRQDAITPIANALEHPQLYLLKNSGETEIGNNVVLNVLSVIDRDNWVQPTDRSKINIALYHGSISGCSTDLGWIMDSGEDEISIFKPYDYALLGDIHKTNQIMDADGRVRYAGSTVQQNHGETNDKGFLIWDIQNKDVFDVKHISLLNPKPFVTVVLTKKGNLPKKATVPPTARLRLVSHYPLSLDKLRKTIDVAKHKFKPESLTFLSKVIAKNADLDQDFETLTGVNLRDIVVQEALITEYLSDYTIEEDVLEQILTLNKKTNSEVEQNEAVARNINWTLKSFEWNNMFNYGEGNKVDFTNLNGIVGIFGKNYTGKSSIIDGVLYTLFNSTSKNERKNLNIINQNKEDCTGRVKIQIGHKIYSVTRTSEKYIKRLKGEETLEARTDVNFEVLDLATKDITSLNGLTRNDTDKNIRKQFGTLEDFLLTSMASQLGALQFVSEGSTRRKELLAKFLDLELFEKKFRIVKEESANIKGALKLMGEREFAQEIKELTASLIVNKANIKEQEHECADLINDFEDMTADVQQKRLEIDLIPTELIDIEKVRKVKKKKTEEWAESVAAGLTATEFLNDSLTTEKEILEFLQAFDINIYNEELLVQENYVHMLDSVLASTKTLSEAKDRLLDQTKILETVPCGDEYKTCSFKTGAYKALEDLTLNERQLAGIRSNCDEINEKIDKPRREELKTLINKYEKVVENKNNISRTILEAKLKCRNLDDNTSKLEAEVDKLQQQEETYFDNKEKIDSKDKLVKILVTKEAEKENKQKQINICRKAVMALVKENGSIEAKITVCQEERERKEQLEKDYAVYDLYQRCMHSSGISYNIIKKRLPIINNEIAKILTNIVDFEMFFENDGKHLKMFIKHPKHEPRPLEMGSGAEKTISAMAIRLALLTVSSLPKSDIFILDEPGSALDADNMDGFVSLLDLVKSHFNTILLISHLESLKDCADQQITIEKNNGYAYVSV